MQFLKIGASIFLALIFECLVKKNEQVGLQGKSAKQDLAIYGDLLLIQFHVHTHNVVTNTFIIRNASRARNKIHFRLARWHVWGEQKKKKTLAAASISSLVT
jgi:hypothetical protein